MCKRKQLVLLLALLILTTVLSACGKEKTVVVYTSVDQVYSEKIFSLFEQKTGIVVKPVYDIEASKSVGLANRLVAEKDSPQADVFWNGEVLQTLDLKEKGVLEKADIKAAKELPETFVDTDGQWFAFGGRARVLLVNTSLLPLENCPKTMEELAVSPYIKQAGIAYPIFGTTSTQAAALYTCWGDEKAKAYFEKLKAAGISVLEGNSVVKDYVSAGKLAMGLTDTDDALSEMETNKNLAVVLLDQGADDIGTMLIPNTVAKIAGGPDSSQADAFIEFLLSSETEQAMVDDGWIHIPVHSDVTPSKALSAGSIKFMQVDFNEIYKKLELTKTELTKIFVQ